MRAMRIVAPIRNPARAADLALAELAARQHGVVSRQQLLALGLTARSVQHRIGRGRLHRIHPGVYAVGHGRLLRHARYLAAVLACGEHAVLSHRAAGAVLGLLAAPSGPIDVTVPARGSRRRRGISVHVTRSLPAGDVTTCEGIPVTTWARTITDLAGIARERQVRRALQRAMEMRLFDRRALEPFLASGRRGTPMLRRLLAELPEESPPVNPGIELRLLDLVREQGLPVPVVKGIVQGFEVDFHWPACRLIVETDGRATHDTAYQFEEDRRRDLELTLAGWHVVRVGWRQVATRPDQVASMLRSRLR